MLYKNNLTMAIYTVHSIMCVRVLYSYDCLYFVPMMAKGIFVSQDLSF